MFSIWGIVKQHLNLFLSHETVLIKPPYMDGSNGSNSDCANCPKPKIVEEKIDTAQDFLELRYGLTLTDEKTTIQPSFLLKVMEEYAQLKIANNKPINAVSYTFQGRDYDDALAILEAKELHEAGRVWDAKRRLVQSGWSLGDASRYCIKHFGE